MEKTDHVLKSEKVQRLTGFMDKAMKGVRRIAVSFNSKKENKKAQFVLANHGFIIFFLLLGLLENRRRL